MSSEEQQPMMVAAQQQYPMMAQQPMIMPVRVRVGAGTCLEEREHGKM